MMLHLPNILTSTQLTEIRQHLQQATWQHGALSAGQQAAQRKHNLQLDSRLPATQPLAEMVRVALMQQPLFLSAVLPKQVLMPSFNCYQEGGQYGNHVDAAIQYDALTCLPVRTDVSTTVFLSEPEEYEGGELIIEDTYGCHEVKLAAGDAVIYSATSLHRVEAVTHGQRLAAFLWAQSMVRDDWQRHMLFNLDMTILRLRQQLQDSPEIIALTSHYHNLLRQWTEL